MKQRFTYLDLLVVKNELDSQLVNYRLQNIYDLASSSRQFLLKFQVPNSKKSLFIDPGFRIHLTVYSRSTASAPSGFVAKLRKHLKTRRLSKISVASGDRTLVFSFSDDHAYHLVLEFFAGGNMLLLNKEFKILALQRVVSATDNHARYAVGEKYDIQQTLDSTNAVDKLDVDLQTVKSWLQERDPISDTPEPTQEFGNGISIEKPLSKKQEKVTLKRLLSVKLPSIATGIFESCLLEQAQNPNLKSTTFANLSEDDLQAITKAVNNAVKIAADIVSKDTVTGYIITKKKKETHTSLLPSQAYAPDQSIADDYIYEDFQPFEPITEGKEDLHIIETATYNEAIDKYFSSLEASKLSQKFSSQEIAALRKLEAARSEKQMRVSGLTQIQEKNEVLGTALQMYSERVEEACDAVRILVNQGMDWTDIENLIKVEKSRGNPVAHIVDLPLNLAKNRITVILPDPTALHDEENSDSDSDITESDEESSDLEDQESASKAQERTVKVEVDLSLSAWASAKKYFGIRKSALAKQERTIAQSDAAYKRAEKKIQHDLKKAIDKDKGRQTDLQWVRNPFWFEKFYWFQSSDGYLCIGGRDAVQNELLLQKYFKKNDIYVHSEVEGSSVVVIKNHLQSPNVPPSTLTQAGAFAVASSSKAWDSKLVTSAWWATREQIPKISAEGDPVTVDFVVVNGEGKHFLPPTQLDMGLGFFWLIPEESLAKYPSRGGKFSVKPNDNKDELEDDSSDEEDFPDTQVLSDDEDFPDTKIDSDDDFTEELQDPAAQESSSEEPEDRNENVSVTNDNKVSEFDEEELEEEEEEDTDDNNSAFPELEEQNQNKSTDEEKKDEELEEEEEEEDADDNDEAEEKVSDHVLDIEKALDALQIKKKGRLVGNGELKQSKNKKEKKSKLKGADKVKAKKEELARQKHENDIKRRDRAKAAKTDQLKRLLDLEEDNDQDEEINNYPFDLLVPRLVSGDEALAAVPVFGPWASLQKLKYKIKLQPGANKKGKAVKEIIQTLQRAKTDPNGRDADYAWPNELSMLRGLKETSLVLSIAVGKVKLSMPGQGGGGNAKGSSGGSKKNKKR